MADRTRKLTQNEINLAKEIFGEKIDYTKVQIEENGLVLQGDGNIVTVRNTIHYKTADYLEDVSQSNVENKRIFIHEMTHVLQHQSGFAYKPTKIFTHLVQRTYDYDPIFHGAKFNQLTLEAQAEFIQDLWLKRNGEAINPNKVGGTLENPNRPLSEYEAIFDTNILGIITGDVKKPFSAFFLPAWLESSIGLYNIGVHTRPISPLVLDLDNDGIELTRLGIGGENSSSVYFDMDNDNFAQRTAWVTGGDGLLALDRNGNGIIDNQSELFGEGRLDGTSSGLGHVTPEVPDGFAALRLLDTNNDKKMNASDTEFNNLKVWIDANVDGKTDAGELKTLSQLGITEINLNDIGNSGNIFNNANKISSTSTFTMNGQQKQIVDAWFLTDPKNTYYTGDYTLDVRTLFLPTLKGFGTIKDLHVAMSLDSTLLSMVEDFTENWNPSQFGNQAVLDAQIKNILLRWAGVDGLNPNQYGTLVDYREVAFLEKISGTAYTPEFYTTALVDSFQSRFFPDSFDLILRSLKSHLILQADSGAIFDNGANYSLATGEVWNSLLTKSVANDNEQVQFKMVA